MSPRRPQYTDHLSDLGLDDVNRFSGFRELAHRSDHGDYLAQARELVRVAHDFTGNNNPGRNTAVALKVTLQKLGCILDDMRIEQNRIASDRASVRNTPTITQTTNTPTNNSTLPDSVIDSLLQTMNSIHSRMDEMAVETSLIRNQLDSNTQAHKQLAETVVNLVEKQAPTVEEKVYDLTVNDLNSQSRLVNTPIRNTHRHSDCSPSPFSPPGTSNKSKQTQASYETVTNVPLNSQRTVPPKVNNRKACPKVVFTDDNDLTNEQFRGKLVSVFPELDLPMIPLECSRWNGKTSHKFILTPLGYQNLSKLQGSQLARNFNLEWHLDLITLQCRKCFQYGHGTSSHPSSEPILCRLCGKARHTGNCESRWQCSQCHAHGHSPTNLYCPARQNQLTLDLELYDLDSGLNTISRLDNHNSSLVIDNTAANPDSFLARASHSQFYN